jgi:alkanesulfonate monooxygenase SsuD/methylene tetrahydromethanopterin reductase-like flavin-dependent oxidoreductase (luciferase family)
MRFGLINEATIEKGQSFSGRYHEVLKEAVWAEEMGFDYFGSSEQHFVESAYTISAPETLYGAIAALTSTIKLRHMSVVALKYNHPIRIAERIATLDIISKGRVELGTARSNNLNYLKAFGIDPNTTRQEWRETLEVTIRALMETPVEFHGEFYDFDPISVVPKLYTPNLPPLWLSASSLPTHRVCGELGIGAMTFDNWFGWEYLEQCIAEYQDGLTRAEPIGGFYEPNRKHAILTFPAHCAPTRKQAIEEGRTNLLGLFNSVSHLYLEMAEGGGSEYAYLGRMKDMEAHKNDIEYMIKNSPSLMIGDPDDCIERIKEYEKLGIDEVILKIDGVGHRQQMNAIELFGKYVFPEFQHPTSIPPNDWEALGVPDVEKFRV